MGRLRDLFNRIIGTLGFGRKAPPQDIAKVLSPDTLALVMREATFLRNQHGVDVRELAVGEIPTLPKRAD
jgi:hypothetical protein